MARSNTYTAIIYILLYSLSSATLAAISKLFIKTIPITQLLFIIYFTATLSMLIRYYWTNNHFDIKTDNLIWQMSKTAFGFLQVVWLFLAFKFIPITNALLLRGTAPFIVPLAAYLMLPNDKFKTKWLAILICFIGLYILLHPQYTSFNMGIIYGLLSALFLGLNMVSTQKLNNLGEPHLRTLLFSLSIPVLLLGLWEIYAWQPIHLLNFLLLMLAGIFLFTTVQFFISAYKNVSSKFITPFTYSIFLFAIIYDWMLFQETLNWNVVVGGVIILVGCYINQL